MITPRKAGTKVIRQPVHRVVLITIMLLTSSTSLLTLSDARTKPVAAHKIDTDSLCCPGWTKSIYLRAVGEFGPVPDFDGNTPGTWEYMGRQQGAMSTNVPHPWTNYTPAVANPYFGTVILAFGVQMLKNGSYGARLTGGSYRFVDENYIHAAVVAFARGFYFNTPPVSSSPPKLRIIVGTSNYKLDNAEGGITAAVAGSRWGALVNHISDSVYPYSAQVSVSGGIDIEPAWSDKAYAYDWTAFYAASSTHVYYNFGSADGCYPNPSYLHDTCERDWTQADVWWVSRGAADVGGAIPQVYRNYPTSGTLVEKFQAKQWQRISLTGYLYQQQKRVTFAGVQSSYLCCSGDPNFLSQNGAWKQLMYILNNHDPSYHGDANPPVACYSPPNCHRTDQSSLSSSPAPNIGWSTDWIVFQRNP